MLKHISTFRELTNAKIMCINHYNYTARSANFSVAVIYLYFTGKLTELPTYVYITGSFTMYIYTYVASTTSAKLFVNGSTTSYRNMTGFWLMQI